MSQQYRDFLGFQIATANSFITSLENAPDSPRTAFSRQKLSEFFGEDIEGSLCKSELIKCVTKKGFFKSRRGRRLANSKWGKDGQKLGRGLARSVSLDDNELSASIDRANLNLRKGRVKRHHSRNQVAFMFGAHSQPDSPRSLSTSPSPVATRSTSNCSSTSSTPPRTPPRQQSPEASRTTPVSPRTKVSFNARLKSLRKHSQKPG